MLQLEDEEDLSPIPFWFNPLWIGWDVFMSIISKVWDLRVFGSSNYVWERKLKNTKVALKEWVKHYHKNQISERKEALEKLEEIHLEMEESEITSAMLEKEPKTHVNSFQVFRQE